MVKTLLCALSLTCILSWPPAPANALAIRAAGGEESTKIINGRVCHRMSSQECSLVSGGCWRWLCDPEPVAKAGKKPVSPPARRSPGVKKTKPTKTETKGMKPAPTAETPPPPAKDPDAATAVPVAPLGPNEMIMDGQRCRHVYHQMTKEEETRDMARVFVYGASGHQSGWYWDCHPLPAGAKIPTAPVNNDKWDGSI